MNETYPNPEVVWKYLARKLLRQIMKRDRIRLIFTYFEVKDDSVGQVWLLGFTDYVLRLVIYNASEI